MGKPYQDRIASILRTNAALLSSRGLDPQADPRHVEAWMRLEHSTLDALGPARFATEALTALACVAEAGVADSEALAQTFGL